MKAFRHEAELIAIFGSGAGETFYCDQDLISIGRDSANDIQLKDSAISRYHCVIRRKADQYWVTDLDSKNGTLVNGEIITSPTLLTAGSWLEIGSHAFVLKLDETFDLISWTSSEERRLESRSLE